MTKELLPLLRRQTQGHRRSFVLDSARCHLTKVVLAKMNSHGDFHNRVEEGTTCWCQMADLYLFFVFKHLYRNAFTEIDMNRKKPRHTASEKQIIVTKLVALCWSQLQTKMGDTLDKAFISLGLVPGTAPSDIIPFPLKPHGFEYLPAAPQVAEFERALAASLAEALPKPAAQQKPLQQMSMAVFLKKKDN